MFFTGGNLCFIKGMLIMLFSHDKVNTGTKTKKHQTTGLQEDTSKF